MVVARGVEEGHIAEQMPPSKLRIENSSDSGDLAKLLRGEDARWGGVSSPLLGYYTIIKTREAFDAIFGVALHLANFPAHRRLARGSPMKEGGD